MAKAAFIGADSVEHTRNVLTDLRSFPELPGELEVALHDVDAGRLAAAETMAERIRAQTGARAAVTSSVYRLAAIKGADDVVNVIQGRRVPTRGRRRCVSDQQPLEARIEDQAMTPRTSLHALTTDRAPGRRQR